MSRSRPRSRCRPCPLVVLVLALGGLAGPAPAAEPEDTRRFVAQGIERRFGDDVPAELAGLAEEAARRVRSGWSPKRAREDAVSRVYSAYHAPEVAPGRPPKPSARYGLPFPMRVARMLVSGPGQYDHKGFRRQCLDFMLPEGEEVLAARDGTVSRVVDGNTKPGGPGGDSPNSVSIVHADGTFASYFHLSPGIEVKAGDEVTRGRRLGRAGQTGSVSGPQLHFCVFRKERDGKAKSVVVRFGNPGAPGFTPKPMGFYGPRYPESDRLKLSIDGKPLPDGPLPVKRGQVLRLRVEYRERDGTLRDVTLDESTELAATTLWTVEVVGDRVHIRPTAGFEKLGTRVTGSAMPGTVVVFHQVQGQPDPEFASFQFAIPAPR